MSHALVLAPGFACVSLLAAACGGASEPPPASEPDLESEPDQRPEDDFDALSTLGYVDFSEDEAPEDAPSGVVLREEEHSWPGYDLVTSLPMCRAFLLSPAGEIVRSWTIEDASFVHRVEFTPDGDLIAVGVGSRAPELDSPEHESEAELGTPSDDNFLLRMDFEGRVLWREAVPAHHDFDVTPEGRIACLVSVISHPRRFAATGIIDDSLALFGGRGRKLGQRRGFSLLSSNKDLITLRGKPRDSGRPADVLHLNSIEWMSRPELAARSPLFDLGNVLVCSRHQSAIFIVNWKRRELVWAWRDDTVQLPHEATVTDDGHILLFDNGTRARAWSRIVELDPLSGEITWEWTAPEQTSFFSAARGTVQGLPNGNVLVGNSAAGTAFEVTRQGRVVWRFENPDMPGDSRRRAVLRIRRYAPEFIEPLLKR